jgi:hypothetical protein
MNPIERISGKIVDITPNGELTIKAHYDNFDMLVKRKYTDVEIELIDARPLSDKQRRMCWALINEIAEWQGQSKSQTQRDLVNEARKVDFMISELDGNADKLFSLSNAPMSVVAAYQKYLIHFILANDIPTQFPLYKYADDIDDYIYYCLINKRCAVCGCNAELHHIDRVGLGRDRHDIVHEGMECISLCREHHTEIHTKGEKAFFELYHFNGGIELDKTLCRIYKVKAKKEEQ